MSNVHVASKIKLQGFDDLFGGKDENEKDAVVEVPLNKLKSFHNHPFKVCNDADMQSLVESIRENGVTTPAIVRPLTAGGYELISGHRRKRACELLGKESMPAIIRNLDDDEAILWMVNSNLQREKILPSEKAFSYKMKLEALKRQGKRTDLEMKESVNSGNEIGTEAGDSRAQVYRFVKLTRLIPELLSMVDSGTLLFLPALVISDLPPGEQKWIYKALGMCSINVAQAKTIREYSQKGELSEVVVELVINQEKKKTRRVTLRNRIIDRYFDHTYTQKQIEQIIEELLEKWKADKQNFNL